MNKEHGNKCKKCRCGSKDFISHASMTDICVTCRECGYSGKPGGYILDAIKNWNEEMEKENIEKIG